MKTYKFTLVEVIIILLILVILAAMLLPALNSKREVTRNISCAGNLRSMGLSFKQYALDFNNQFPSGMNDAGLDKLRENDYLTDFKIYACPSTSDTGTIDGISVKSSYQYIGNMSEENTQPDSGLMADYSGNHSDYGNILFCDGHVTGYAGSSWLSNAGNKGFVNY